MGNSIVDEGLRLNLLEAYAQRQARELGEEPPLYNPEKASAWDPAQALAQAKAERPQPRQVEETWPVEPVARMPFPALARPVETEKEFWRHWVPDFPVRRVQGRDGFAFLKKRLVVYGPVRP